MKEEREKRGREVKEEGNIPMHLPRATKKCPKNAQKLVKVGKSWKKLAKNPEKVKS